MLMVPPVPISAAMVAASNVAENEYPAWSAGAAYVIGDRVIDNRRIYECAADNSGNSPAGSEYWVEIGPTNRWAMFDLQAQKRTVTNGQLIVDLVPGVEVDALGLIDLSGDQVRVEVLTGTFAVFSETREADGVNASFTDMGVYAGMTIRVTVFPDANNVAAIGALATGTAVQIGDTETDPTIAIRDFSRRETDDFGTTTLVERAWTRKLTMRTRLDSDDVDLVQRQLAAVRATPVLWIGQEEFEALTVIGLYSDFTVELQIGTTTWCSLTIDSLPSADVTGPVVDPAIDVESDVWLVPPMAVTEAMLSASSVAENDHPVWSSSLNYGLGARVIWSHRVYESAIDGNVGNDPVASTMWLDTGATNRWAMFDGAIGSFTRAPTSIAVTLIASGRVDTLAVLETDATLVRVETPGFNFVEAAPTGLKAVTFRDLTLNAGDAVTVTITGSQVGALVSAGLLVMGVAEPMGLAENSPTIGITDYSKKETDGFGNTSLIERNWSRRADIRTLVNPVALDNLVRRVARMRAKAALWIAQDGFDCLTLYGFARELSAKTGERVALAQFSLEGLTTGSALTVSGGLTRVEKLSLIREMDEKAALHSALDDKAIALGTVEAERAAANDAWTALTAYLASLVPAWDDARQDTPIERDVFNSHFETYAAANAVLLTSVQGVKGDPGDDGFAIVPSLSNDSCQVPADSNGVVSDYSIAAGKFTLTENGVAITTGVTFSVASGTNLTGAIDADGDYSADALTAKAGFVVLRATYNGQSYDKIFTVTKSQDGEAGPPGSAGAIPIPDLTVTNITVWAYAGGQVKDYAGATGKFLVWVNNSDVSSSFTYSVVDNPQNLSVSWSGSEFTIIGGLDPNEPAASLTLRATGTGTYSTHVFDRILNVTKGQGGFEIGASLPTTDLHEGRQFFLEGAPGQDGELYIYTNGRWSVDLDGANLKAGTVTAAKLFVTQLSAITANLGEVTVGVIRNASDTFRLDAAQGRTITKTGAFMKVSGAAFGSGNQFIEWYGPQSANLADCNEASATFYLKTDGSAYFGGTLSAGVLKNATKGTSLASDASATLGPFGSNGGSRVLVVSYSLYMHEVIYDACPTGVGTPSATIQIYRGNSSSGAYIGTLTANGSYNCNPGAGPGEPGGITVDIAGSTTITDNSGGSNATYYAVITSRSSIASSPNTQEISLICTEQ